MENNKTSLMCGSLGNGITIWDRSVEVSGDYKVIAHIDSERKITWRVKRPTEEMKAYANAIATGPNFSASSTQPYIMVFSS